eukprot:4882269-Pyramimonas_sp.AAC.1
MEWMPSDSVPNRARVGFFNGHDPKSRAGGAPLGAGFRPDGGRRWWCGLPPDQDHQAAGGGGRRPS